jgi:hypothetical protein
MKNIFLAAAMLCTLYACNQKELVDEQTPVDPPVIVPPIVNSFRILDSTQMINDLKALSSDAFNGRKAGTPEVVLSHQLIQSRLRQAGVDSFAAGFVQEFSYSGLDRRNFLGLVKGSVFPDKYIVVGAHYDHLGVDGSGHAGNG